MHRYTVLLDPDYDEGGFTVTVPALPGVVTQGDSIDEAVDRAREAIRCHIEGLLQDGEPIPEETVAPLLVVVEVSVEEAVFAD